MGANWGGTVLRGDVQRPGGVDTLEQEVPSCAYAHQPMPGFVIASGETSFASKSEFFII